MAGGNYLEPYLVALFPFWAAGMGLAEFNLLEEATVEEIR